jgi:hypothetical protein
MPIDAALGGHCRFQAPSRMDQTSKPALEAALPLFGRPASKRHSAIGSDTHNDADQVAHLNRDHRRRRDQRGREGALLMHYLNRAGEDYSQKSRWDQNANFKAESENGADEKKDDECHF